MTADAARGARVLEHRGAKRARAAGRAPTRRGLTISSLLPLGALAAATIPVAIECHLEMTAPERSAYAWLQRTGFVAEGPIAYEPGHGFGLLLGIAGSIAMVVLTGYSVRKRVPRLARLGKLPRWLDVHVALGLAGPMLVLFHTAGRLGGIISVAFWSMVVVVLSGVLGRYVYAQVPRTIAGREQSLAELDQEIAALESELPELAAARASRGWARHGAQADARGALAWAARWIDIGRAGRRERRELERWLAERGLDRGERHAVLARVQRMNEVERQVVMLESTRRVVARWHALHVPLVGLLYAILAIHVAVMVLFHAR
ncbi:MAG: hypothetical protein U0610_25800 [bacterium]